MSEWKTVSWKGFDLEVCRDGAVRRPAIRTEFQREHGGVTHTQVAVFKARDLKPQLSSNGYLEICFVASRRRYRELVHRLVSMAFVPGYDPAKCVNHINGDKFDNRPENLEWISYAENTAHAWQTGLVNLRGENQPGSKLINEQVAVIRKLLRDGVSGNSLSIVAGVSPSTIYLIRDGKRWAGVAPAD